MSHVFSKYINLESIYIEIDNLNLTTDQKHHLISLADNSLHHTIMDAVLSNLNSEDKRIFLHHMQKDDHDKTMDFLNKQIDNIEDKIKKVSEEFIEQLHEDVKEAKRHTHD